MNLANGNIYELMRIDYLHEIIEKKRVVAMNNRATTVVAYYSTRIVFF